MIFVIQCAATKNPAAGRLASRDGTPVLFVAKPEQAPSTRDFIYARPDQDCGDGASWRSQLLRYNLEGSNPFGLLPACKLYSNPIYERMVDRFGIDRVFILSAGWGLISASFLTPAYDITFSAAAEGYKRRSKTDHYLDFQMIPNAQEEAVFFGGKDYLPLFRKLTDCLRIKRTAFYNSSTPPDAPDCTLRRFLTATRTNWHYECLGQILDGSLTA